MTTFEEQAKIIEEHEDPLLTEEVVLCDVCHADGLRSPAT